jgi:hypothetical protein
MNFSIRARIIALLLLTFALNRPSSAYAQNAEVPVPSPLAPATTMTIRGQTGQILSTGTLMQQNVGRRLELYREAGISAEKISRLEFLHQELFTTRLSGETTRSLDLRKRINDALNPEELAAVEAVLRRSSLRLREQIVAKRTPETTGTETNPPKPAGLYF